MGARTIQYLVSLFLSVFVFINSFGIVWPSYALKILESEESPLGYSITKNDGNLIGSVVMLGSLPSILIVGYVNEKIGRKSTEILTGLCFCLSWSIIATAKSITQLVIGRFIFGLSGGMQLVSGYLFISEISQTSLRGIFLTIMGSFFNIGALASYLAGWFCSYDLISYMNLSLAVAMVVFLTFLKETPSYLLKSGKEKEALQSLKFYRGAKVVTQEILDEFDYIRSQQQMNNSSNSDPINTTLIEKPKENEKLQLEENLKNQQENSEQSAWEMLKTSKSSQRAIILTAIHMILSVSVGMIGIQAYAGQMFRRAAPNLSPDLCSVLLAIVMTIAGGLSIVITNIVPRRFLMISTTVMSSASLATLGSLLRWSWAPEWTIPFTIVIYCIFFQIGVINVPFLQVGECISPKLNSFGTAVGMFSMYLASFLILLFFEPAVSFFGLDGVFFLFALMGVVAATVAFFTMRETRNVPFEIINETFDEGFIYRPKSKQQTPPINTCDPGASKCAADLPPNPPRVSGE